MSSLCPSDEPPPPAARPGKYRGTAFRLALPVGGAAPNRLVASRRCPRAQREGGGARCGRWARGALPLGTRRAGVGRVALSARLPEEQRVWVLRADGSAAQGGMTELRGARDGMGCKGP